MSESRIRSLRVSAYVVPTDQSESDGTLEWRETTLVLVEVDGGDQTGIGFTYGDRACASLIHRILKPVVESSNAFDGREVWLRLRQRVRNVGRPGVGAMAISAVDLACWDLRGKLVGLPLCDLLGRARPAVPVYGSGGFTSYSIAQLQQQLAGWAHEGVRSVKMKIGADADRDPERVHAARAAIGPDVGLFVDANGAFDRKQALRMSEVLADNGVSWFEEPVTSDDLPGLRLLRDRVPARMEVAAGEYGSDSAYFRRMLETEAVDVLQADITRCEGLTGFLDVAALCQAFKIPLSAHTAPSMHLHACLAAPGLRHLEYFHDHARIEHLLFDGAATPRAGVIEHDPGRTGHGLEFKRVDAERFAV